MIKKRYFAKKPKGLPKGYDSKLEYDLHNGTLKGYDHHPAKLKYYIEHTYEPDFVHDDEPNILFEVKGRFRDSTESGKYNWIQKCNPNYEIIFIFEKPATPMPFSKKRKDGTKMTHGEWATKNGFRWCSKDNLEEFLNGV